MSFPVYFLSLALTVLGMIFGVLLAFITPYELKQGYRYFVLLQAFLLVILLFIVGSSFSIVLGFLFALLPLLFLRIYPLAFSSTSIFTFLGLVFFLASQEAGVFLLISCLIFLYGLATGTAAIARFAITHKQQSKLLSPYSALVPLLLPLACYVLVASLGYIIGGTLL